MATIGLDKLYYALITDGDDGETYGTPKAMAGAISVNLTKNVAEASLSADNRIYYNNKSFSGGTIDVNVADIEDDALKDIFGATKDSKGGIAFASEDMPKPCALGYRALKANGKYRYQWLLRVQFAPPGENVETKGESITYTTPTVNGTIMTQNKESADGKHYYQYKADEDATGVDATLISGWFTEVKEPTVTAGS